MFFRQFVVSGLSCFLGIILQNVLIIIGGVQGFHRAICVGKSVGIQDNTHGLERRFDDNLTVLGGLGVVDGVGKIVCCGIGRFQYCFRFGMAQVQSLFQCCLCTVLGHRLPVWIDYDFLEKGVLPVILHHRGDIRSVRDGLNGGLFR